MAYTPMGSWGAEIERIRAGGLASSTEDRLTRLRKWGGFTSFLTPRGLGVGADCGGSFVRGSMKPFTIIAAASSSERPRYCR